MYPRISFIINKLFRNFMSDAINNKSFGSRLTDINQVSKRIE